MVRTFRPDAVFHLAGQVAMTTSLKDPRRDFETNVLGGFNLLEAVRVHAPKAHVIYSSTNKVYGGLTGVRVKAARTRYLCPDYPHGFDETLPLDFQSPYGCSKGAVDQYMLDYHRMYGLKTTVFRHSSIFGGRQYSTFDQGWIGYFVSEAIRISRAGKSGTIGVSGDGRQVRDVLFAPDIVSCYRSALAAGPKAWGQAFNIGGGMDNSLSLVELFKRLESMLNIRLSMHCGPWRASDQKVFVADTRKALRLMKWKPRIDVDNSLRRMIDWVASLER
jgi:CDP-paratose 2-epimerase